VDVGLRDPFSEGDSHAVVAARRWAVWLVAEGAALDLVAAAAAFQRL